MSCRASESVLPWLYGIATNLLRSRRRVERRQLTAYARTESNDWIVYEDDTAVRASSRRAAPQLRLDRLERDSARGEERVGVEDDVRDLLDEALVGLARSG